MFSSLRANRRCPFLFAPAAGAATFPPPAGGASLAEVQRKLSAPSGRTCLRSSSTPAFRCRKKLPPVRANMLTQFVRPGQSVQKKGAAQNGRTACAVRAPRKAGALQIKIPKGESPCHRLMTASSSSRASARKRRSCLKNCISARFVTRSRPTRATTRIALTSRRLRKSTWRTSMLCALWSAPNPRSTVSARA